MSWAGTGAPGLGQPVVLPGAVPIPECPLRARPSCCLLCKYPSPGSCFPLLLLLLPNQHSFLAEDTEKSLVLGQLPEAAASDASAPVPRAEITG